MDENNPLKLLLEVVAERQVPAERIDIVTSTHRRITSHLAARRKRRTAILVTIGIVVFLTLGLATPQGQVIASRLFQFFISKGTNVQALPTLNPHLVEMSSPAVTVPATQAAGVPPFVHQCGSYAGPVCSPEQLQALVTFPVKELTNLPSGIQLRGATGGPNLITLQYTTTVDQEFLQLVETPWTIQLPPLEVGSGATIEVVQVGAAQGEYVRGAWINHSNVIVWHSDANTQTLRWVDEDVYYQLILISHDGHPSLNQQDLVRLASNLGEPAAQPDQLPGGRLTREEAEQKLGRAILLPASIPDGYQWNGATVLNGDVCLHYRSPNGDPIGGLHIAERAGTSSVSIGVDRTLSPLAGLEKEFIPLGGVGGAVGVYGWGSPLVSAVCNPDGETRSQTVLVFQTKGTTFEIFGPPVEILTRLELARLAESLTGVQTTGNTDDPQKITSAADAQRFVDFPLLVPTLLPKGWNFHHAVADPAKNQVTLYYKAGQDAEVYGAFTILQRPVPADMTVSQSATPDPAPTVQPLKVGSMDGEYRLYCSSTGGQNMTQENIDCSAEVLTWQQNGVRYSIEAGLPISVAREILTGVALSLTPVLSDGTNSIANNPLHLLAGYPLASLAQLPAPYEAGEERIAFSTSSACRTIFRSGEQSVAGYLVQSLSPLSPDTKPLASYELSSNDQVKALLFPVHQQEVRGCGGRIEDGVRLSWMANGLSYDLFSASSIPTNDLLRLAQEVSTKPLGD
ncbi:MAG TPA: hypothetical protein VFF68_13620 [Anaerolineaceae bacterium]|nr:hypothetical protein [Anaerolineaceae bacterium]